MPDPIMFREDAFVVLETNQPEQFLTAEELLQKLASVLETMQDSLPRELQDIPTLAAQARHLLDTACELDIGPGQFLQWYAVRLEK
ncbi:chlororespiratory reduction protein 7 [Thermoleptolyngbya sichuanensis A183]|uniref:Chlororespiratory reduction protein 7 n=2 Tax=Thermoleptolyngbya TaxID=2303528 RepID=A0A6M8B4T2_9CYAN|nr:MULTISPECIES: chlororespiratory reduction protein 7 [Thermoleptolyngbya]MDG2615801.1 chlororespiratory reduction protein 7 [Thermoleptolyngbya sichuanensis XZ-Cy5]QKD81934.1 chlororespiratory reduction protein 7 [Thermoleptolyngbya sichuanensis A183]WOB43527.1 chlororespiratory reduction protein 7 [Thermoleptolyngbya oregonensis NK1-22]